MKIKPYKVLIFGLLSVAVIANLVAIFVSTQLDIDLTSADYYEREINYEETLEARRRGQGFQWTIDHENNIMSVHLKAHTNSPMPVAMHAYLYRPQTAASDFEIELKAQESGLFNASMPLLDPGKWRLTLRGDTPSGAIEYQTVIHR